MTAITAVGVLVLAGCSSSDTAADSNDSPGEGGNSADAGDSGADDAPAADYGECEVYGDAGSISIDSVNADTLTVQTNLPSPGWWKGESPTEITGGYEYCLGANIAYRAGLNLVIDNVSFDALVAGQTKNYDLAMAQISITPERAEVVEFSEPYFDSNIGILAPADSDITEANIRDHSIGVQVGTTSAEWAEDDLKPEGELKLFEDTTSMVTAVTSGMADAAAQDTAIMLGFAANSDGKLAVIGQYETGEQYAAIYPKDSANAEVMNQAIKDMHADGTLDKLSATWLGPELGGDPAAVPVWKIN